MSSKRRAAVDQDSCVACGACSNVCPMRAIKVENGCYAVVKSRHCIGCGKCAAICPAGSISIINRGDEA